MRYAITSAVTAGMLFAGAAVGQQTAPTANQNAPANTAVKNAGAQREGTQAIGANSFTEKQARKRIMKSGYLHISRLTKDDAGLWQGTATQHGKSVHVALDYKGNITSN